MAITCYNPAVMQSVADGLRAEDRAHADSLTPAERVALALAIGARDLEIFSVQSVRPALER